ncbi:MAG: DUF5916 domain-containing protein [Gemmatimonadaceae bacterium]|nr:DUF5916 domain-containing protein [Gemmatimonadaceae bacterium]
MLRRCLVTCSMLLTAATARVEAQAPATLDAAIADSFARAARARPRPVARAVVVKTPPVIDGRLDDAAWQAIPPITDFVQRELNEGLPPSERTEVRLATDGEYLYVSARLFDREPALIVPGEKIRDVPLANSDHFAFILDTYRDRQNGFVFGTTPAGIEYDGQVIREGEGGGAFVQGQTRAQAGAMGGFNLNWDASWTVRTSIDSLGWSAEFRIPFATIRYEGDGPQTWGLNFVRSIRRKNEELYWSFIPRQFSLYRLSLAGSVEGLVVPRRRIQTITPYVLASSQERWTPSPLPLASSTRRPREVGADAKIGLTPALTLDLTYNTDFAQVEVDDQRVNLTRFPIFFPEKRPFFLENAGVFSAGTPQAVDFFFTRRIGIDANGNPRPILGGGRLSGRVGGVTVGALQMVTEAADTASARQSFTVARTIKEVGARSRVGAMFVQRLALDRASDVNRLYALDGRLGVGQDWTIDAWGARTETPGRSGRDHSLSTRVAYQTRNWDANVRLTEVGDDFNPEVGFLSRPAGYRALEVTLLRWFRRPEWAWFRHWNPHISRREYRSISDNFRQTGYWHIDVTQIELADGTTFGPEYNISQEGLQVPFEIAPGVILPPGQYQWGTWGFDYTTDPSENLWATGRFDVGEFWTGTRRGGSGTVTLRRGAAFSGSLLLDHTDVRLPQGNFARTLSALRLNYFFTPRVFVQTLTQFNNQQRIWSANVRFGWLNTAGTGLFVVFNDGREAETAFDWVRPQQRTVFLKFTRQFGTGG